ncbi:MAG: hypothetical protein ABEJ74_03130 [Haloferacaceae archaeon]
MPYLIVRHTVEDFDEWKAVFDDHAAVREEYGSRGGFVGRVAGEPDEVVTVLEIEDLDRGREFADSDSLREAMDEAGVVGKPELTFLEKTESFDS